jgi:hypothetical protein
MTKGVDMNHELMQQTYGQLNNDGFEGLTFEWCCKGRHGAIRNVPKNRSNHIESVLIYFFGNKCSRWKDSVGGTMSVEFVPMTKVYPPPKKPWEWCGKTLIFGDWLADEKRNAESVAKFSIGDPVYFTHNATRYEGVVANVVKRVTVIVPHHGKFYIPGKELHHV